VIDCLIDGLKERNIKSISKLISSSNAISSNTSVSISSNTSSKLYT